MGADIKKLRNRIKSVDSTLHLTKAMGLVASSKIRRATEGMLRAREYRRAVEAAIAPLMSTEDCKQSAYMKQNASEGAKACLLVIAGDRGMAGGYNANVFRTMREYPDVKVIPVGKRACDRYFGELRYAEAFSYADAREIADEICKGFVEGRYSSFGILYTVYVSMLSQEATVTDVLPLTLPENAGGSMDMIFEPGAVEILDSAVPEYVAGRIFAAVRESFASEVAARRCAMDSAGKNAQEMIDTLQLDYNRARQGAITQEITEIVAGANA